MDECSSQWMLGCEKPHASKERHVLSQMCQGKTAGYAAVTAKAPELGGGGFAGS